MQTSTIGVVGVGTKGSGIAQVAATKGLDVILIELNEAAVAKRLLRSGASRGHGLRGSQAGLYVIVEAATDDYDLKAKILKQMDKLVSGDAIIGSNTSSISITRLVSLFPHPDRLVGVHFFNPVSVMALIEIVRGLQTSDATHAAVATLATRLGKSSISVKSAPGFVVNRVLLPMINEAFFVLAEGETSAKEIDEGMKLGCNHPIGPLALADMIGLDVLLAVMQILHDEFADSKYRPYPLLKGDGGRRVFWGASPVDASTVTRNRPVQGDRIRPLRDFFLQH